MILNLEAEKTVDSSKRLGIVSGYSQLRTTLGILGLIGDLTFQLLHGLYTWWHRGSMVVEAISILERACS